MKVSRSPSRWVRSDDGEERFGWVIDDLGMVQVVLTSSIKFMKSGPKLFPVAQTAPVKDFPGGPGADPGRRADDLSVQFPLIKMERAEKIFPVRRQRIFFVLLRGASVRSPGITWR